MVKILAAKVRPLGITILALLEVISGLMLLLSGVALAALLGVMGATCSQMLGLGAFGVLGTLVGTVLGSLLIILGLISFLIAWGLWTGRGWAWTLGFVLAIIGLIMALLGFNIVSILINLIVIYYLTRPHVKAFFGKAKA